MGGTGDGSGVGSGLGGSGSGAGTGLGKTSGPEAVGTAPGDMIPSKPFRRVLHKLPWGITKSRDGKCWLPLPHGSGTIVNLTPSTSAAVDYVIQL